MKRTPVNALKPKEKPDTCVFNSNLTMINISCFCLRQLNKNLMTADPQPSLQGVSRVWSAGLFSLRTVRHDDKRKIKAKWREGRWAR